MNTQKLQPKFLLTIVIILVFAVLRVFFPGMDQLTAGLTSVGAITVFGGAMFSNRLLALVLPVAILFISDLAINRMYGTQGFFYDGWILTYVTFGIMALASIFIMKKVSVANVIISAIVTTALHWTITSTGYWASGGSFANNLTVALPKNFYGFATAHLQAIPFELKLLAGTLLYSTIIFGVFYFVKKQKPTLAVAK